MISRARDIRNLQEAARRCRAIALAGEGPRATDYRRLAEEIDGMIASFEAELYVQSVRREARRAIPRAAFSFPLESRPAA